MHEISIAAQILETAEEFAQSHQPCDVLQIQLEIGELTGVERAQLQFCFNSIKKSPFMKESWLEITFVGAKVQCPHCLYEGRPKWVGALAAAGVPSLQCPQCSSAAQPIQGHDCLIKSIQLREDNANYECHPV